MCGVSNNLANDHLEIAIFGKKRAGKSKARDIRVTAYRLIKPSSNYFETMVKITSWGSALPKECGGKTSDSRDHSNYITRNNKLEVENELGEIAKNRDEILAYFQERDKRFFDQPRYKGQRDTLHMVLSAPDFVTSEHIKDVTREFCKQTFNGYRYVFVLHEKGTDPDGKTEKAHCHIDVECLSIDGKSRLRIDKDDLQHMREVTANIFESYGYTANATPRAARGIEKKGDSAEVSGMKKREEDYKKKGISRPVFTKDKKRNPPELDAAIAKNIYRKKKRVVVNYYKAAALIEGEQLKRSKEFAKGLRELAHAIDQGKDYKHMLEKDKSKDLGPEQ